MFNKDFFHSRVLLIGLIGAFCFLIIPKDGLAQAATGSMTGFLYGANMKTPVENATVKIRSVQDGKEYTSSMTGKEGLYAIKNILAGRYILGVSGPNGDFNFDYEISIKAGEVAKLALALTPTTPGARQQGDDQNNHNKGGFFLTPLGIAILLAAGGLLVYGGFKLFEKSDTSAVKR
jgi:hypothetical protein